ncbi:MAG: 2-hydroxyacyl-CoA dehydratase family protein [Candidatus Solibacter sp.]
MNHAYQTYTGGVQFNVPDSSPEIEQLQQSYRARLAGALGQSRPVAGVTSNTAPWELLCAAGYFPVLLSPANGPAPFAAPYMEAGFDGRTRSIFDRLLSGEWSFLHTVVIPRTSEQEHKLFLYLREVARQEPSRKLPRTLLFNLLHAQSAEARTYGLSRTRELWKALGPASMEELAKAIADGNAARGALRALLRLRADRLSGAEALPLLGAYYFMDRADYARLAVRAADIMAARPAIPGPRVMIKGSMLDHPHLHRAIEGHGAVVAAEDDWWGSRAAGQDVSTELGPLEAVFLKYYEDAPSPRVFPASVADAWFLETASTVAGVVFYISPDDDVRGWDYPRQRSALDARGIPHLLLREDPAGGDVPPECHDRIEEFTTRLKG